MRFLSCIAFLTLMVVPNPAAEDSASPILQESYARLLSARFFAFGDIQSPYGGPCMISIGEQSLRTLATNTNGLPLLRATLTNGTTAARLYALCGIRHLAPDEFDSLALPLVSTNAAVVLRAGSMGMVMAASNIVARIKSGSFEDFLPPAKNQR